MALLDAIRARGGGEEQVQGNAPSTHAPTGERGMDGSEARLTLPIKPSIAVLPFDNISGDPEQEYFAAGIVEDITTALARFPSLFVIARNSAFTYKGRTVAVEQVGHELGVRYVLEGSVRRAGERIRVNAQLIDAGTGAHLWAEQYDGSFDDILTLQDRITETVAATILPTLDRAEVERVKRKHPDSLDAYDHRLQALAHWNAATAEDNAKALVAARKAIEADADYAEAHALAAGCFAQRVPHGCARLH